jgi:hypothetical protein
MPKEAHGIAACVAAVIAVVFLATYAGPYRFFADLQIASRTRETRVLTGADPRIARYSCR